MARTKKKEAIRASIADPDYYRLGGLLNGVAHIFIPHTLKRDVSWFKQQKIGVARTGSKSDLRHCHRR